MKYLKRNTLLILLILIITMGVVITICSFCETEPRPNIVIGNHYASGQLYVIDAPTQEVIKRDKLMIYEEKYLFLDPGIYKIRLIVDTGQDPGKQDREMTVFIVSNYTTVKVLFR